MKNAGRVRCHGAAALLKLLTLTRSAEVVCLEGIKGVYSRSVSQGLMYAAAMLTLGVCLKGSCMLS